MKKAVVTLGERICIQQPENPELSRNGGDYFFYKTPVLIDGVKAGVLLSTSAEFDYCQLSGWFGSTKQVLVEGAVTEEGKPFFVDADYYGGEYISLAEFQKAIQATK